jgi:hypothetical protein
MIVGEGKTDSVYLRLAIRHLKEFQPVLGAHEGNEFRLAVRLFNYHSKRAHELLNMRGGTGDLISVVLHYRSLLPKIEHRPLAHPVILVMDNDSGLESVAGTIKKNYGITISTKTTENFYHVTHNLYVVKTPEAEKETCIESLFPNKWLDRELKGKKFNSSNKYNSQKEYGKVDFAEKVVLPNAADIDFSGFVPLLKRIKAACDHYKTTGLQHPK